jgi:selenocysteine lyase/cysteine desulfurase
LRSPLRDAVYDRRMPIDTSNALDEAAIADGLRRWRIETPGCATRIHLNNAGAALMPRPVADAIRQHIAKEEALGGYEAAEARADLVGGAYASVAKLVNARPANIAVVENATVAVAEALSSLDFARGDVIVTTQADYPSNQLMYLSLARRLGVEVRRAEELPEGGADPQSVREILRSKRCRVVAVSWVPTNSGLVQPVAEIGRVCEEAGVPFVVDACQAVGQLPIHVGEIGCDFLAASARKFMRGPRGIGFLYVSDRVLKAGTYPLYLDMRGADWTAPDDFRLTPDARRFENWEFAYALVLGMGAAADYALEVGDVAFRRSRALAAYARERLATLGRLRVLDRGPSLCAIVTAAIAGRDASEVKLELRKRGVNTSASDREDGVIDMDRKGASSALRVSPHYYNTKAEVDSAVAVLDDVLRGS